MTAIPVLLPPVTPELAVPYLTPAGFRAYPHWLDLDDLIPGGAQALQDDDLADVLLAASTECVSACENMPLSGHYVQGEQLRTRIGAAGRVYLRPRHIPARAIVSLSWGFDPSALSAVSLPDPTMWNEQGKEISFRPGGGAGFFTGPAIEFGPRGRPGAQLYVSWSYVAAWGSTVLDGTATPGSSVQVTDPTGILPGDVLRIYDPGASEAVTVSAAYAPAIPTSPPTPTSVPLAGGGLAQPHAAGTGITGMPRAIIKAVICYTVAALMREDVSDEPPQSQISIAARSTEGGRGGAGGGLINDAEVLLGPYRPEYR